jgi:hypothetical protein
MTHEHETPAEAATAPGDAPEPRPELRPGFLDRAHRILSGDVRPEDYLPVTPEVEAYVARDLAFLGAHVNKQAAVGRIPAAVEIDPAGRFDGQGLTLFARQRNQWLLSVYHGGQNVAYLENEAGVIVLGVGLEEGGALIRTFPYELRKDVGFGTAEPLEGYWH